MSWSSRIGNLGRFSPFTRSPPQGPTKVSDADFSYITADDLRRHQADSDDDQRFSSLPEPHSSKQSQPVDSPADYGPTRDTDMLVLKNRKRDFNMHFPAYSIAKSELIVGQVREHAAKKTGTADLRRIKLLYRGKNLKDDSRTCKAEGLRDGAELMCVIADNMDSEDDDDDDEEELDEQNGETAADGEPKRRRNRGKRSKRRNRRLAVDTPNSSGTSTPQKQQQEHLSIPTPNRQASPRPPPTPLEKLAALQATLRTFMPDVDSFMSAPPADPARREHEHKRLSETILAQVLLKLDAVETEGDADARGRRKELVRQTQAVLHELDTVVKG